MSARRRPHAFRTGAEGGGGARGLRALARGLRLGVMALLGLLGGVVAPLAEGFAGLGSSAEGFALPDPGVPLAFPQDHGPHPGYRIEWWYLTANLTGADGREYGAQWTLFRTALSPMPGAGWADPQVWMGHAAVTTASAHFLAERLARGGTGQAGVTTAPFAAWIDEWEMTSRATPPADPLSALRLAASGSRFAYRLDLAATGPLVLHGAAGHSVKSAEGQASYYYSQPFYRVTGTLTLPGGPVEVTGTAWLDREWSSQPLAPGQTGWDWVSLHFESGEKLMGFRLRDAGAGFTSATWISATGEPEPLPPGALRLTPLDETTVAGRSVPTEWRIELPARGLDITTTALNPQAWMATLFPYWEGPVRVSGSHPGRGYLEMTGYQ